MSPTRARASPERLWKKSSSLFTQPRTEAQGSALAIVFNIVNKHNGKITIQSEEGKGTMFTITLPKGQ